MHKILCNTIVGLSLLVATNSAFAAFVNFVEGALETDPITVTTNLFAPVISPPDPETASVSGFHDPSISPSPVVPGLRSAGLFEPGSTTLLSDYVLFSAGEIIPGTQGAPHQDITVQFFSIDTLVSDLLQQFPNFQFMGGVEEDGTLQDLSLILRTLTDGQEGVSVRVQSDASDVPEPGTLVLAASGLAVLGLTAVRRKRTV